MLKYFWVISLEPNKMPYYSLARSILPLFRPIKFSQYFTFGIKLWSTATGEPWWLLESKLSMYIISIKRITVFCFILLFFFSTPVVLTNSRVAAGIFGQIFVHAEFTKFLLIQILFMNIANNIYQIFPVVYFGKW